MLFLAGTIYLFYKDLLKRRMLLQLTRGENQFLVIFGAADETSAVAVDLNPCNSTLASQLLYVVGQAGDGRNIRIFFYGRYAQDRLSAPYGCSHEGRELGIETLG